MVLNTKISSALFDFVQPILDETDENTTKEQIEKGIEFVVGVWNAVVIDSLNKNNQYTNAIRHMASRPEDKALIERFIDRKNNKFSHDLRMIADFNINYEDGYLHIQAKGAIDDRLVN
tara:strand:- start:50 stop:403 length:354 start_codon:yes stop_codon:yes gene_type:complete